MCYQRFETGFDFKSMTIRPASPWTLPSVLSAPYRSLTM
jgi:hypothetical protein